MTELEKRQRFDFLVIGDTDTAGELGAAKWLDAVGGFAVKLPYRVTTKHGADLRDFINERVDAGDAPHEVYAKLLAMHNDCRPRFLPTGEQYWPTPEPAQGVVPPYLRAYKAHREKWSAEPCADEEMDHERERILSVLEKQVAQSKPGDPGPPTIEITTREWEVIDEAVAALPRDATLYQRGSNLVAVVRDARPQRGITRPPGSPRIIPLHLATVRERLSKVARWVVVVEKKDDTEEKPARPPNWAVDGLMHRGEWPGVCCLEGVVESPVLRPDGTIFAEPGFDEATGLLLEPNCDFPPIPDKPTQDEIDAAVRDLWEVVCDFPFKDQSHRAAWLASLLTPLARFAFDGPSPLFIFEANNAGVGKGLLADVTAEIAAGRAMARMVNPADDDEMRKRITSLALEGAQLVLIDNVEGKLGTPSLNAALTATTWKDRILGTNRSTADLPLSMTWFATANNVVFDSDTVRRVLNVRLESSLENPEERRGFAHDDLRAWVRRERGRLTAAALTLLRGYCAAGRPGQPMKAWGSFEGWSGLVRAAVRWATGVDPATARDEMVRQGAGGVAILKALIAGWVELDPGCIGLTVSEAFGLLETNLEASRLPGHSSRHEPLKWELLRTAIAEWCSVAFGQLPKPKSFGMKLHHLRGKNLGGWMFDSRDRRNTTVWLVRPAGDGCGTSGTTAELKNASSAQLKPTGINGCGTSGTKTPECRIENNKSTENAGAQKKQNQDRPELVPLVPLVPHSECEHEWVSDERDEGGIWKVCSRCGKEGAVY